MNKPKIGVTNEVIGLFMGGQWQVVETSPERKQRRFYYSNKPFQYVRNTENLNYHKDWNALMDVWKFIHKFCTCDITGKHPNYFMEYHLEWSCACAKADINAAYDVVYKTILMLNLKEVK